MQRAGGGLPQRRNAIKHMPQPPTGIGTTTAPGMMATASMTPANSRPPDSGAFVTPLDNSEGILGKPRLDSLSIQIPSNLPSRTLSSSSSHQQPTTPTTPISQKLSTDATQFICFAVHRIWHRLPKPPTDLPSVTTTTTGPIISPPNTESWFPAFFTAVHTLIHRTSTTLPLLLIALLYIARLRQCIPPTHSGEGSEYRVFVSALILAQKYHTDDRYANKTWAKITGLPLEDINTMEREFLTGVGGRLHVTREEYEKWLRSVRVLGMEHSGVLRRAQLEQHLAVAKESLVEDLLRRARTVPERQIERPSDAMVLSKEI